MALELVDADLSKGLGSIAAGLDEVLAAGVAGYTVWRDPTGHWHTLRPDGTEIE